MQTERLILSAFVLPELLILFGILWIDLQYKTNRHKKQEKNTPQSKWFSVLLLFVSLGVSLVFNYLMYVLYFTNHPSDYMYPALITNPLVVVLTMAFALLGIEAQGSKSR